MAGLLAAILFAWGWIGSRMSGEDPLRPAELLVVLGGGLSGERDLLACDLYKKGWVTRQVVLTGPLFERFVPNRINFIKACGIPGEVIVRWNHVKNTYEEMVALKHELATKNIRQAIVVSDEPHMPRIHFLLKKMEISDRVILRQSRIQTKNEPLRIYKKIYFWYREPAAYLYYRITY